MVQFACHLGVYSSAWAWRLEVLDWLESRQSNRQLTSDSQCHASNGGVRVYASLLVFLSQSFSIEYTILCAPKRDVLGKKPGIYSLQPTLLYLVPWIKRLMVSEIRRVSPKIIIYSLVIFFADVDCNAGLVYIDNYCDIQSINRNWQTLKRIHQFIQQAILLSSDIDAVLCFSKEG